MERNLQTLAAPPGPCASPRAKRPLALLPTSIPLPGPAADSDGRERAGPSKAQGTLPEMAAETFLLVARSKEKIAPVPRRKSWKAPKTRCFKNK